MLENWDVRKRDVATGDVRARVLARLITILFCGWTAAVPAADVNALIDKAYKQTSSASTVSDYDAIIQLCTDARQAGVKPEQDSYLKSLMSWAHNRRGEAFTESANDAQRRGEKNQAAEFDGKALADFEVAIQLDATRWKPWHNRGVSRAIAGKYREAITDFSKVIELNPEYANAWFNRAEIHFDLGQFENALTDYAESLRLDPKDAGALTSRGDTYFRLGKLEEALADYSEAIRIKPEAGILANRGDAYQRISRWREAAEDYREAIQLDPGSSRILRGAAWLMATCPDTAIRNANKAVEAAEMAVQGLDTPDSQSLDTLAAAYANASRFDEAVAKMNEAIASAAAPEVAALKKRLELYRQKQPYRQDAGSKTANTTSKPKR